MLTWTRTAVPRHLPSISLPYNLECHGCVDFYSKVRWKLTRRVSERISMPHGLEWIASSMHLAPGGERRHAYALIAHVKIMYSHLLRYNFQSHSGLLRFDRLWNLEFASTCTTPSSGYFPFATREGNQASASLPKVPDIFREHFLPS